MARLVFWGKYLPSLSINYVGMSKVMDKRLPQLYHIYEDEKFLWSGFYCNRSRHGNILQLRTTYYLHHSCYLNVTPSSKVDVGDVAVSQGSLTAAEQLKPKEKQREDVTEKFRYDHFGYLCMVYFQIICHFQMRNTLKFDKVFLDQQVLIRKF